MGFDNGDIPEIPSNRYSGQKHSKLQDGMPIYDISGAQKATPDPVSQSQPRQQEMGVPAAKGGWLSSLVARLFFIALLILDLCWGCYSLILLLLGSIGAMLSFGRVQFFLRIQSKSWLSIKRSIVCALALLTAVFTPAFGIMIACTYFLMYDKNGIEEIVPESLQGQFKEFFPQS